MKGHRYQLFSTFCEELQCNPSCRGGWVLQVGLGGWSVRQNAVPPPRTLVLLTVPTPTSRCSEQRAAGCGAARSTKPDHGELEAGCARRAPWRPLHQTQVTTTGGGCAGQNTSPRPAFQSACPFSGCVARRRAAPRRLPRAHALRIICARATPRR